MSSLPNIFYTLTEASLNEMEKVLKRFVEESQARLVMLVDRTGYLIYKGGVSDYMDPEDMSNVLAGILASLKPIIQMTDNHDMTLEFHEPLRLQLYCKHVNNNIILVASTVLDKRNPAPAEFRQKANDFLATLAEILRREETQNRPKGSTKFIMDKLDEIFD